MDAAVLVLLLLALIWAAVLIPPWIQARRDQGPAASMRSFHRQLWSLERASPVNGNDSVNGRSRFGRPSAYPDAGYAGSGYVAGGYVSAYPPYVEDVEDVVGDHAINGGHAADGADVAEGHDLDDDPTPGGGALPTPPPDAMPSPDLPHRRSIGYRRRRRVLTGLLVAVATTLAPALTLGSDGWWIAQAVANVLLVGYLALLVQRQRRLRERREKIRYLTAFRPPRPSVVVLQGHPVRSGAS